MSAPASLRGESALVTGATGFIGAALARRLLEEGASVHAVIRPGSCRGRLADFESRLTIHEADLTDRDATAEAVRAAGPRVVFHLAAEVDVRRDAELIDRMIESNFLATVRLARAAAEAGARRVVCAGTCEEYGQNPVPYSEDQPIDAVSPYGAAKGAATVFNSMMARVLDYPIVTLRPFLTYGPGQSARQMLPAAIQAALRGEDFPMSPGEQTREFNYIDDIVEGFVLAASAPDVEGETINLASGRETSILALVERVYRITESSGRPLPGEFPYRPGESMRFYGDGARAQRLLNWRPGIDLEEGLTRTIAWYRDRIESEGALP